MFRFESTSALMYLWLIPVLVILAWVFQKRSQGRLSRVIGKRLIPFLTSSVSSARRRWKLCFQSVVVFFFVLALARPQLGESKQEVKSEGVEIMLAIDVSESMMAEDVRPSRLEQVKMEMAKLVDLMPGNKVGIVAFAGSAALLSPLTTDPASLKMYLDSLTPLSVSSQGTNFQAALSECLDAFKRGGVTSDEITKVTRVILIASDGEDHEQGALDEAQKMTKEGVRIFTLAYGTEKGAPIPERDGMGFLRGYKKDQQGKTILTTVVGKELQALAQAGQGSFYHAAFGGNHLQNVMQDMAQLEKTEFESEFATQYEERFQLFVLLGIIFALLEITLGDRRPISRLWKGRFEVSDEVSQ